MCIVEIPDMNFINQFHQQSSDKRIKANEDQDFCFCGGSEKSRLEQKAVLKFPSRRRENLLFHLKESDFTKLSIEVIEKAMFQNNYSRIPIS